MDQLTWIQHQSSEERSSIKSASLQAELEEALHCLSYRKDSRSGSKLMSLVRQRFKLSVCTILFLLPIWILFAIVIYMVGSNITVLQTLHDAENAYKLSEEIRVIGGALGEEWLYAHRYLVYQGNNNYNQLLVRQNITQELIERSQYLSLCLSLQSHAVSSKEELQRYFQIFRTVVDRKMKELFVFYTEILKKLYFCSLDLIQRIDVPFDWNRYAVYEHLQSAHLHLMEHKFNLPLDCRLKNDSFEVAELRRLANIALSKLSLATYFMGIETWWVNENTRPSLTKDSPTVCTTMYELSNSVFNRTVDLIHSHSQEDLASLAELESHVYGQVVTYVLSACLCIVIGTFSTTCWILKASEEMGALVANIRDTLVVLPEEYSRSNEVISQIIPINVGGSGKTSVFLKGYQMVTLLYMTIPRLQDLCKVCSPDKLIDIVTFVIRVVEERISLYNVNVIQKAGSTYSIASGVTSQSRHCHAVNIANIALDLLNSCSDLELSVLLDTRVQLRMGIASGPCIGTIQQDSRVRYCLVGSAVECASKLEKTSQLNAIHVSSETVRLLTPKCYRTVATGNPIRVGGEKVNTYWLVGRRMSCEPLPRSDRKSSTFSSKDARGRIQLAAKPLYRYDSDENVYIPLPCQPRWHRKQATRSMKESYKLQTPTPSKTEELEGEGEEWEGQSDALVNTFCEMYPSTSRLSLKSGSNDTSEL